MNILNKINRQVSLYNSIYKKYNCLCDNGDFKNIEIYDTSLYTDNLGDQIINYYCNRIFEELNLNIVDRIPTHIESVDSNINLYKIVTGTNLLSSHINRGIWKIPRNLNGLDKVIFLGVGWEGYSNKENLFTKKFFANIVNKNVIHSVRDSYTERKLKSLGVTNVINTACPTMWKLNVEHCKKIPKNKAMNVITTITDYNRDETQDWCMLDILLKNYTNVYIWLQGDNDLDYLKSYYNFDKLKIVENSLPEYTSFIRENDVDYIGTRLHAGIHALNFLRRTIIISIDNRAKEIALDTNLPILDRSRISEQLDLLINSQFETRIKLPDEKISFWKEQFYN